MTTLGLRGDGSRTGGGKGIGDGMDIPRFPTVVLEGRSDGVRCKQTPPDLLAASELCKASSPPVKGCTFHQPRGELRCPSTTPQAAPGCLVPQKLDIVWLNLGPAACLPRVCPAPLTNTTALAGTRKMEPNKVEKKGWRHSQRRRSFPLIDQAELVCTVPVAELRVPTFRPC